MNRCIVRGQVKIWHGGQVCAWRYLFWETCYSHTHTHTHVISLSGMRRAVNREKGGEKSVLQIPESDKETSGEVTRFSEEEEAKFTRRYENGYDLLHDCRYNEWLSMHHPEHTPQTPLALDLSPRPAADIAHVSPHPRKQISQLSQFLHIPAAPGCTKTTAQKNSGARVLTSTDHIRMLEEKERRKRDEAEQKLKRKKERLERKALKELAVKKRAQERALKKKGWCSK